jgi:hypothetical protein
MIDNLPRGEKSLGSNHDSTSGIEVGTSKNKLVSTSRRLSAIATGDNSARRQDHTRNTSLSNC